MKEIPSLKLYRLCIALLLAALVLVTAAYLVMRSRVQELELEREKAVRRAPAIREALRTRADSCTTSWDILSGLRVRGTVDGVRVIGTPR
jgi:hypothetical protein